MRISKLTPGVAGHPHEIIIDMPNIDYNHYMSWVQTTMPLEVAFRDASEEERKMISEVTPFDKLSA